MNSRASNAQIRCTAGALPVRNEKGEISMKKVKVHRYISGKRPEYAHGGSNSDSSDLEDFIDKGRHYYRRERRFKSEHEKILLDLHQLKNHEDVYDARLNRLRAHVVNQDTPKVGRRKRHRDILEPEIIESKHINADNINQGVQNMNNKIKLATESDTESDLSDTELENRRKNLRQRILLQKKEEEILVKEEEKHPEPPFLNNSEYEGEESESGEEEEIEPRLKPIFIPKRERTTIQEKKEEEKNQKLLQETKKIKIEKRRTALRLVEESVKMDLESECKTEMDPRINDICTDDENDEVEYEAWKLRELKRLRRDREEKESYEREKLEIERLRNLTDEERKYVMRAQPRIITNQAKKGKYKYLQKYYHRGAFFMDEEKDVLKRDFTQPTLEDHFDKTILPKVMQVKNFGRCGQTKYTHLVDQDTTTADCPWAAEIETNIKFHNERGGGMKQIFDRPSSKRNKRKE